MFLLQQTWYGEGKRRGERGEEREERGEEREEREEKREEEREEEKEEKEERGKRRGRRAGKNLTHFAKVHGTQRSCFEEFLPVVHKHASLYVTAGTRPPTWNDGLTDHPKPSVVYQHSTQCVQSIAIQTLIPLQCGSSMEVTSLGRRRRRERSQRLCTG